MVALVRQKPLPDCF